jgi:hypothetical protein
MKKFLRSQTKVASRAVHQPHSTLKANPHAAQHREKRKAYERHWTAGRSAYAHGEAFT